VGGPRLSNRVRGILALKSAHRKARRLKIGVLLLYSILLTLYWVMIERNMKLAEKTDCDVSAFIFLGK